MPSRVGRWILPVLLLMCCTGAEGSAHSPSEDGIRKVDNLDLSVFNCSPNPRHLAITSDAELRSTLEAYGAHCRPEVFEPWRESFLASFDEANIDLERQTLVIVGDWYGTGMAKAKLELELVDPTKVRARIVWTVPSGPVTPDTAVFRGAFVVDENVKTIVVEGRETNTLEVKGD